MLFLKINAVVLCKYKINTKKTLIFSNQYPLSMRKGFILLITIICALHSMIAQTERHDFVNYSIKDGLSQNRVNCVMMDSRHYIWIGTNQGINRFNGRSFEQIHPNDPKYKDFQFQSAQQIFEDKNGFLWIRSENKIYRFDYLKNEIHEYSGIFFSLKIDIKGNVFNTSALGLEQYNAAEDRFICLDTRLKCFQLYESDENILYLADKKSIYSFDIYTKILTKHDDLLGIKDLSFTSLFLDWEKTLWILTNKNGCYQLKKGASKLTKWEDPNLDKIITGLGNTVTGNRNLIYFTTSFNGIVIYNPKSKSLENIYNQPYSTNSIIHNNTSTIYFDNFGGMWVGTSNCGVDYLSRFNNGFTLFKMVAGLKRGLGTTISFEEFDDNIYVGTEGGLIKVSKVNNVSSAVIIQNAPKNTFEKTGVKYFKKIDETHLWLAPFLRGLHLFNIKTNRIEKSIENNILYKVNSMIIDKSNRTWIAAGNGLGYIDFQKNKVMLDTIIPTVFKRELVACLDMIIDKQGRLIIATNKQGILFYNTKTQKLAQCITKNSPWLPENNIVNLMIDSSNQLWVSTSNSGLVCYDMKSGQSRIYNKANGMISNSIYALAEDREHNVWCTSSNGITRINSDKIIQSYTKRNGYPIEEAEFGSLFYSKSGELWIGGNNGFAVFSPTLLKKNNIKPDIEFCNIAINNLPKEEQIINKKIKDVSLKEYSITLNYNSFPVVIDFNAINYTYPGMNKYAYKLTGVYDDWKDIGNNGSITLPILQSGSYTFHVKAANNDNVWNDEGIKLHIKVLPPFWLSWWAYLIYITIVTIVVYNFLRYYKIKTDLENEVKIRLIEKKNSEQAYEDKLRLYTNFSHELRTPLTLITSPVNELIAESGNNKRQIHLLELVRKNTNRILFLVNQLLDYRKVGTGNFTLYKQNSDLITLINNVISAFSQLAEEKKISINFPQSNDTLEFAYDESLIKSLFYNLLSNAFKFSYENGNIVINLDKIDSNDIASNNSQELNVESHDVFVKITVSDNGIGITPEHLNNIFTRFYQVETGEHRNAHTGTGIGLHFCNDIVKLHQGAIFASSDTDKGTTFTVLLPFNTSFENKFPLKKNENEVFNITFPTENIVDDSQSTVEGEFTVLVVEDNIDIRSYICEHLEENYTVLVADNGRQALKIININDVSLIISDVMMPIMDGIEFCNAVKNNIETSHIPLILLTARTAEEHIIEGYRSQADDYISKPFNVNVLCARVDNLIRRQLLLSKNNGRTLELPDIDPSLMTLDDKFLKKVYSYIEENISDSKLNLYYLSKEIGVSKVHLNRKIKALTTLTPARLILKQRFKRSEQLMVKGEKSITELAYACGFTDAIYFSRCFKQEYNLSPTDYIKSIKKE